MERNLHGKADGHYDVIVIGAGPGGYEAAIKAAQMGKKTCMIERTYFGGTCLNVGCIPTKTLIRTANLLDEVRAAAKFAVAGVESGAVKVDMTALQRRKSDVVSALVQGVRALLKGNGVTVVEGSASFLDARTLAVGERVLSADDVIIATGSKALIPPFLAPEGEANLLTSTEMLSLEQVPASVAVIGGGVIGIEFAYLLNRLGSKVTVLELMDHILPMVDPEVSALVQRRLARDGVVFHLGAQVRKVRGREVLFEENGEEKSVAAEAVLAAVGRAPNTEGLNAASIGLRMERGAILTDGHMRTNVPHVYAIGDVNGRSMLAHTASHEGITAVHHLCGGREEMEYERIPSCIYLGPEVASIGLTEPQARERYGETLKIGRFRMFANGRSLVEGDTDGMVKVILHGETGAILGAHIYAGHATEMIGEVSVAMAGNLTAETFLRAVHPHPTVCEALGEAFQAAWTGKAINAL